MVYIIIFPFIYYVTFFLTTYPTPNITSLSLIFFFSKWMDALEKELLSVE